jgi:O-succinylbenzoic acid--CoA ligase
MIATSGTTGRPRAVALTGHNLTTAVRSSRQCLGLCAQDVWLNALPLTHIGGFAILLRCLEAGAAMLLHETFEVERIRRAFEENCVSHISLVPAMLARLLEAGVCAHPASRLRHVLIGGSRLDAGLAREARDAGWPLCVSYGMTETASHVCLYPGLDARWQPGDAGKPLAGVSVTLVADDGKPTTGTGRIRITGPMVMAGYMRGGKPRATGSTDSGLTTHDLGYLDDLGHLHVLGRTDEILVSGGRNIHPHEVEGLLQACPGVRDVAVTALPDPVWGDRLIACFAGEAALGHVERWCRDTLPGSLRPREFRKFTALPRDAMGKLMRAELRQAVQNGALCRRTPCAAET